MAIKNIFKGFFQKQLKYTTDNRHTNYLGIAIIIHCPSNTGYAIISLEEVFYDAAIKLFPKNNIHYIYPDITNGLNESMGMKLYNIAEYDLNMFNWKNMISLYKYIKGKRIIYALGFDQPTFRWSYVVMRLAGLKKLISYYGAPMGSINWGIKLILKKIQVALTPFQPEHYIFETNAMIETAIKGRGLPSKRVSRIYLGVDTEKYCPSEKIDKYCYKVFDIPLDRHIIFYSGHMEPRKGVSVIIRSAIYLIDVLKREDIHFLITGNKEGEEKPFIDMMKGKNAINFVTFGGYRNDIERIHKSCYLGVIASTGWDSMTMSSIEMAASGIPLIVSNLQGLPETVEDGITGHIFNPGDYIELASLICNIINDKERRAQMSKASRERAINMFSREKQVSEICKCMRKVFNIEHA